MVMPVGGTFDYVAVVPDGADDGNFECGTQSLEPARFKGHKLFGQRLVGLAPTLTVAEAGLPSESGPGRPWVMRSRLTLTATSPERATVAKASFHVDRALARRMLPRDVVHLGRTDCAGLALSILRKGELVAAVGAVTIVPLGQTVRARLPNDLIDDALAVFRRRDPEFEFGELPVEVIIDGASRILRTDDGGSVGRYEIFVRHGFIPSIPGRDECGAIWHKDLCPSVAARASVEMLDIDEPLAMAMSSW
jgi:hypothetical protein